MPIKEPDFKCVLPLERLFVRGENAHRPELLCTRNGLPLKEKRKLRQDCMIDFEEGTKFEGCLTDHKKRAQILASLSKNGVEGEKNQALLLCPVCESFFD